MSDLKVFDLTREEHSEWLERFSLLIKEIQNEHKKDRLIENYINLDKKINQYEVFNIITNEDRILGFSGMHSFPYPKEVSRVLSRLFYTNDLRQKNLRGHSIPSFASRLMLPLQIEKAKQLEKKMIFLSFEGLNRRAFCIDLSKKLTKHYNLNWEIYDEMANTVKTLPNGELNYEASAWQNIVYLKLDKNYEFSLPSISIDEWRERFE